MKTIARICCFSLALIAPLSMGCQNIINQASAAEEQEEPIATSQLVNDLKTASDWLKRESTPESIREVAQQAQELEDRLAEENALNGENAAVLLETRTKLFALDKASKESLVSFCKKVEEKFRGQATGLQATLVRYIATHDLSREFSIQDLKDVKSTATGIPSHKGKATFYSTIVRRLHSKGQVKSAQQTLQLGMSHLKGTGSWSQLFNEQFALGYKQDAPGPTTTSHKN